MKSLLDFSPALIFFGAYLASDIYTATIALIVSLYAVVLIYRAWKKEWNKGHLVGAVAATVLGGLTLIVRDPNFIKFKPTAVYAVFAIALAASNLIGSKPLLQRLPQDHIRLPDSTWRTLHWVWSVFFVFCALLNVYVAMEFSEDTWVKFKTFGFTALMFVFMMAHAPFLARHFDSGDDDAVHDSRP